MFYWRHGKKENRGCHTGTNVPNVKKHTRCFVLFQIYLIFLAVAGLCCSTQAFSNCDEWATLHFAVQASR